MTRAARPLLWPLVPVYQAGLALREFELRSGLKRVRRLGWPVVSIGNLSTGGAGKTPLTIALARALAARDVQVDVLSRGYGRRHIDASIPGPQGRGTGGTLGSALPLLVDPRGNASEFGDEPLVIAREAGVPVYVAAERIEAGVMAERRGTREQGAKGPREQGNKETGERGTKGEGQRNCVHLLDDGFQHRQLHRDVDILLLSRADLNDHLLPAGNLREPWRAAERAHVIAIPADEADLEAEIRSHGWRAEVWRVRRRMEIPALDSPVAAFCGIARPEQFFAGLEAAGVKVTLRTVFPDHYNYSARDFERITAQARSAGATALVTTEKDRARLGAMAASMPVKTVPLRTEIEDEEAAVDGLLRRIRGEG